VAVVALHELRHAQRQVRAALALPGVRDASLRNTHGPWSPSMSVIGRRIGWWTRRDARVRGEPSAECTGRVVRARVATAGLPSRVERPASGRYVARTVRTSRDPGPSAAHLPRNWAIRHRNGHSNSVTPANWGSARPSPRWSLPGSGNERIARLPGILRRRYVTSYVATCPANVTRNGDRVFEPQTRTPTALPARDACRQPLPSA